MSILEALDALNRAVIAKGHPSLSTWWFETLTRFVTSRKRQLVVRVGRRGGKSSTLCRFAVAFALAFNVAQIPPGDVGVIAFISTTRDEASQRLRTIKSLLDVIGIGWRPIEGGIELTDRPIVFKTFAATIATVSGFTAILVICDEVAKWRDADTGANPATEVLAAVGPTMATQPDALRVLSSSPLGREDAHASSFERGETPFQAVAHAATWEANPIITEQATRELEADERIWRREYEAIPQTSRLAAFDELHVERAFDHPVEIGAPRMRVGIIDASSVKNDDFAFGVCGWRKVDGEKRLVFDFIAGFEGGKRNAEDSMRYEVIVQQICDEFRAMGITRVYGDQREAFSLGAAFRRHGMRFTELTWTSHTKELGTTMVRRWLAEDLICLPAHDKLRQQLLAFEEKVTTGGGLTFGARGSGHDDYVSLLVTAALADQAGHLPGSPNGPQSFNAAIAHAMAEGRNPVAMIADGFGIRHH